MIFSHIKTAFVTLRRSKWRSVLTMLGVIVGVASVVTAVSLGEGVKRQVTGQIDRLGPDVVTVLPGLIGGQSNIGLGGLSGQSFTEQDLTTIAGASGVKQVVPLGRVSSVISHENKEYSGPIIATLADLPNTFSQDLTYGTFFTDRPEEDPYVAVIGKTVAEELYNENVPIGKPFMLRGKEFRIRGVFEDFDTSPLTPGIDYNQAIFIPYRAAKEVSSGTVPIYEILAKPVNDRQVEAMATDITKSLSAAHGNSVDFTVLQQAQRLETTSDVLNILTGLVASIAAISLLVGGIGIMNIMLLAVSERYHEIGVRKAVGATNQQILSQFMTEASILSLTGGVIGVLLAMLANYFMRVFTELKPVITWQISLIAVLMAMIVGIIFGIIPAWQAAKKDPIDALRHE